MDVLISLIVVVTSQCTHISKHHAVHLKYNYNFTIVQIYNLYKYKIQFYFTDYTLIKLEKKEGNHLNIIKVIYEMPIANIILSGEKPKAFLLRSRTWQGCQLLPLLFNIVLAVPARAIRWNKKASKLERKQ